MLIDVNLLFLNVLFPMMVAFDGVVKVFNELSAKR